MNNLKFLFLSEHEQETIILCLNVMQNNISAFTEYRDRIFISAALPTAIAKIKTNSDLSSAEFTAALHSIEFCYKALHNTEPINKADLKKLQPYKKTIKFLYKTYGKILFM